MADMANGSLREAFTFDDVLLRPGLSEVLPSEVDIRSRITREHRAQYPGRRLGDGYRHGGRDGDRHGAGRRHRGDPPQHGARGPGRLGASGQKIRIRHGGEPADHSPGGDAGGRAGADAGKPHFRRSGRGRRQGSEPAGRHPHQPRRALRHRPAPEGRRTDDQGSPGHGDGKCEPRGSQAAAAPAPHREARGGGRPISLRRADYRQGHRKGGGASERLQGRTGAAAGRGGDHGRRQRLRAHRAADRGRGRPRGRGYRPRPFQPRARRGAADQAALECGAGGGRQCGDRAKAPRR